MSGILLLGGSTGGLLVSSITSLTLMNQKFLTLCQLFELESRITTKNFGLDLEEITLKLIKLTPLTPRCKMLDC